MLARRHQVQATWVCAARQVPRLHTFHGELISPSNVLLPGWLSSTETCLRGDPSTRGLPCLASRLASSHSSTLTFTGSMSATLEASSWCSAAKAIISSPSLNRLLQSRLPILRTCSPQLCEQLAAACTRHDETHWEYTPGDSIDCTACSRCT